MKLLLDMNIPPEWEPFLQSAGWEAVHLAGVDPRPAEDEQVLDRARQERSVLFAHDWDLGSLLELVEGRGPSVFQVTSADIMVTSVGPSVVRVLRSLEETLEKGALVTVDMETARARVFALDSAGR